MAPTQAQLEALDEAHRARQASNAEQVAKLILAYWLLVDPQDVSGSGLQWLDRSQAAIVAGRQRSGLLSAAYVTQIRRLHLPGALDPGIPAVRPPDLVQIRRSLAYVGLGNAAAKVQAVKKVASARTPAAQQAVSRAIADIYRRQRELARGETAVPAEERALDRSILELMETAGAAAAAASVRHVQNAGRQMVEDYVQSDRVATGFVRITRDDPCFFCSMLASRGPIYKGQSFDRSDPRFTGPGEAKVHDSCGCTLRPVYTTSPFEWPERTQDYADQWSAMKRDKHPDLDLVTAWRRMREGRPWRFDDDRVRVAA
jgi:hypothetical protein